jgi:UDP-2,3-diacylglucosamine hydrolase
MIWGRTELVNSKTETREITLAEGVVVIADLHLDPAAPVDCEEFAAWVRACPSSTTLIILGDLFDAWVGPGHASSEGASIALGALKGHGARGGTVHLLWGNRDFLLDERVAVQAGATLHGDALVGVDERGRRTLFVHGDELCTLDVSYQRMRRVLRSKLVSGGLLSLPLFASLWLARRLRNESKRAISAKAPEEMAMQEHVVASLCESHGSSSLVCGHAHRWRDETVDGGLRWIVLDAFGGDLDSLTVDSDGRLVGAPSGFKKERRS